MNSTAVIKRARNSVRLNKVIQYKIIGGYVVFEEGSWLMILFKNL
jgi:hypothetical protein